MSDRDWGFISGIAQAYRVPPSELARLMLTPTPPPPENPTHEPYRLTIHLPGRKTHHLRTYACQRPPLPGVGKNACPICAIPAIADASRCNLALGITDLADYLKHLPARQRKDAVFFTHGVAMISGDMSGMPKSVARRSYEV
jgi:hypothetical protein